MKQYPLVLLCIFAFLTPIIGGQLNNDAVTLEPGLAQTLSALHGVELPGLQHFLLALFPIIALLLLVVRRRVIQLPQAWFTGPLVSFVALACASLSICNYRWSGAIVVCEWGTFALISLAVVAGSGRKLGARALLYSLTGGCSVTAVLGLLEYSSMKSIDASWRIFGGWYNPNALAGMLFVGILVALALVCSEGLPRAKLLLWFAILLIALALMLTGSKGGLISTVIGLVTFAAFSVACGKELRKVCLISVGATIVLMAVLGFGLRASAPAGSALARVTNGASSEQSAGFRANLWRSALQLIKANPVGSGAGSFGPLSAKPGITTRTELAHSSPLQIAVECGVQALIAFAVLIVSWLVYVFRGTRRLPSSTNVLKGGLVAATIATIANGFVESNLYYYGIGATLFLLLGLGLQLSTDAVAPEFAMKGARLIIGAASCICIVFLLYVGIIGKLEAGARYLVASGNINGAKDALAALKRSAPADPEVWYRSGLVNRSVSDFKRAAALAPTAKYLRALARVQMEDDAISEAEDSLRSALFLDPNNLTSNFQMIEVLDRRGDTEQAKAQAEKMLKIEETPYFQIRSIPEDIPLETARARVYLTRFSRNARETLDLLKPAIEAYEKYAEITVPYSKTMGDSGGPVSVSRAREAMQYARQTAQQLIDVAKAAHDVQSLRLGQGALDIFERALDGLK